MKAMKKGREEERNFSVRQLFNVWRRQLRRREVNCHVQSHTASE